MKEKRFEVVYSQGTLETMKIIIDTRTGVQYLAMQAGYAGGLTPLLDRQGKPILSPTGGDLWRRTRKTEKKSKGPDELRPLGQEQKICIPVFRLTKEF